MDPSQHDSWDDFYDDLERRAARDEAEAQDADDAWSDRED